MIDTDLDIRVVFPPIWLELHKAEYLQLAQLPQSLLKLPLHEHPVQKVLRGDFRLGGTFLQQ